MMEKRGTTSEKNLTALLKQANDTEETLVINLSGIFKYASGKPKSGIAIIATGPRAQRLQEIIDAMG